MVTLGLIAVGSGIFGGVLAGLLGVGGGIVIVPALYIALSLTGGDPAIMMQVAVGTSLLTIVFTSMSSAWGHYKKGAIDVDLLKMWLPSIVLGVVLGGLIGGYVGGYVLVAVFAVIAGLVALDMIFRPVKEAAVQTTRSKPFWAVSGVFAGGISAMMGIGGGTVCVPTLKFLGYDIKRAVGTSAAIGFFIGVPGAITYVMTGLGREGLPPFSFGYVNLFAAAIIIPFSTSFAKLGVRIAHAIPARALQLLFGMFLLITSGRMFYDLATNF